MFIPREELIKILREFAEYWYKAGVEDQSNLESYEGDDIGFEDNGESVVATIDKIKEYVSVI